jgi:hypothetical protein
VGGGVGEEVGEVGEEVGEVGEEAGECGVGGGGNLVGGWGWERSSATWRGGEMGDLRWRGTDWRRHGVSGGGVVLLHEEDETARRLVGIVCRLNQYKSSRMPGFFS